MTEQQRVQTEHPEYAATTAKWRRCRDLVAGSDAVKNGGYLLRPTGMSREDFRIYKARASYFGAMPRTVEALAGAVFHRPPTVTVPNAVLPDLADVTLRDESLDSVALNVVRELLTVGRCGILLDRTKEESERPFWSFRPAESIVNWRTSRWRGDPDVLSLLVLREHARVQEDDYFSHKSQEQYRELALVDGIYQVRLWTKSDPQMVVSTDRTPLTPGKWIVPTRRGEPLSFIPFCFVGPDGITPNVAKPPLLDLVDVNLGHYFNSADHEIGLHLVALPTPWASGIAGEGELKIGPSVCWKLEKDGRAGMLEFSGAGLKAILEAMEAKEKLMAVLGARLLEEQPKGSETATAVRMRHSGEAAALRTIASSVSAALTRVLRWHAWWVGTGELPLDVRVDLSSEFFRVRATADEIRTALLMVQADELSYPAFYHILEQGGWTRPGVTAEEEQRAIERADSRLQPM